MNETQDFSLAEKITQECERTCTNLCSMFDDWDVVRFLVVGLLRSLL